MKQIKIEMIRLGINNNKLSELSGINKSTISEVLNGKYRADDKNIKKQLIKTLKEHKDGRRSKQIT